MDIWGFSILAIHPKHTVPGDLAAPVWPGNNLPVTLPLMDVLCPRCSSHSGALIPSTYFPSPVALSLSIFPTSPPSRQSLQRGYLILQASCHNGMHPSHAPATIFNLPVPSVLQKVASSLPSDCIIALGQQTSELL